MHIQAVFQRYLRPDKDYLSFSLIYNNGKRSLDLVSDERFAFCRQMQFVSLFAVYFSYNCKISPLSRFARIKLRLRCGLRVSKH